MLNTAITVFVVFAWVMLALFISEEHLLYELFKDSCVRWLSVISLIDDVCVLVVEGWLIIVDLWLYLDIRLTFDFSSVLVYVS